VLPRAQDLLREVQARTPANDNGSRPTPAGWDAVRDDPTLARLLGAMFHVGLSGSLRSSLGIPKDTLDTAKGELRPVSLYWAAGLAKLLLQRFDDTAMGRETGPTGERAPQGGATD
jgi:hypothetical protein